MNMKFYSNPEVIGWTGWIEDDLGYVAIDGSILWMGGVQ